MVFLLLASATVMAQDTAPKSRVYYALDTQVLGPGRIPQPRVIQRMVDSLVCELTGKPTVAEAWRTLVTPQDKVGIKVSTSAGRVSGTHVEVANAIATGLREAGVPADNIIVWDRNLEDLQATGYVKNSPHYRLRWIDPSKGYDAQAQVSAPVLGRLIWGDRNFGDKGSLRFSDMLASGDQLSSQSYYATVLSKEVTKVINVPSLTDSFMTGINGALASMTLSNLDNWRRFIKEPEYGDPYIAEIYSDQMIRDKVVLTILDALIIQYAGGPFANPSFTTTNSTLFASRDPVAIDALGLKLVDEQRTANKLPPARTRATYLQSAETMGLGKSSEAKIDTIRVGIGAF